MYADDVLLIKPFILSDATFASVVLKHDLELIADWSASNGLSLNPAKSQCLVVDSPLLSCLQSLNVTFNSIPLETPSTVRILGLHVECSWSFGHHVILKCKAAYARLRLLYPLRHVLNVSQKLHLSQLLLSPFDYADIVYIPNLSKQSLSRCLLI